MSTTGLHCRSNIPRSGSLASLQESVVVGMESRSDHHTFFDSRWSGSSVIIRVDWSGCGCAYPWSSFFFLFGSLALSLLGLVSILLFLVFAFSFTLQPLSSFFFLLVFVFLSKLTYFCYKIIFGANV